jgi:hypothetical protein
VEGLVDVLHDDERLRDGAVAVEEHGDLLVDRVVGEQELALVAHVVLDELVGDSLEAQGHLGAVHVRAEPADELHRRLLGRLGCCLFHVQWVDADRSICGSEIYRWVWENICLVGRQPGEEVWHPRQSALRQEAAHKRGGVAVCRDELQ